MFDEFHLCSSEPGSRKGKHNHDTKWVCNTCRAYCGVNKPDALMQHRFSFDHYEATGEYCIFSEPLTNFPSRGKVYVGFFNYYSVSVLFYVAVMMCGVMSSQFLAWLYSCGQKNRYADPDSDI